MLADDDPAADTSGVPIESLILPAVAAVAGLSTLAGVGLIVVAAQAVFSKSAHRDMDADFRDFSFGNVVAMHSGMNPDFFKGTVVEDAVEKFKAERAAVAAE